MEAEVEEARNQVKSLRNFLSASNVQLASLQENLSLAQDAAERNSAKLKGLQVRMRLRACPKLLPVFLAVLLCKSFAHQQALPKAFRF